MSSVLMAVVLFLAILSFAGLYRAYVGPTAADRVVAINVTATKVTVMIVLIAVITNQDSYVNVALVYAMIGFVATIGVAKYLLKGTLK